MASNYKQTSLTEAEKLLQLCDEGGQSDYALVLQLQNVVDLSTDIGVISERICMKVEGGVAEVRERNLAVTVSAVSKIHDIKQAARKRLEKEDAPDPVINLIVQETRLEDIL